MGFIKSLLLISLMAIVLSSACFIKTNSKIDPVLFLIRWIHSMIFLFNLLYVFMFDKKYDLLYIALFNFMIVHWLFFKNECILSYVEKKIMDKNYKLGDEIFSHPYSDILFDKKIMYILTVTQIFAYMYVSYRFFKNWFPKAMVIVIPVSLVMMSISTYNFFVPPNKRNWSSIS